MSKIPALFTEENKQISVLSYLQLEEEQAKGRAKGLSFQIPTKILVQTMARSRKVKVKMKEGRRKGKRSREEKKRNEKKKKRGPILAPWSHRHVSSPHRDVWRPPFVDTYPSPKYLHYLTTKFPLTQLSRVNASDFHRRGEFSSSRQIDRIGMNFPSAQIFFADKFIFHPKNHFSQNRPKIC